MTFIAEADQSTSQRDASENSQVVSESTPGLTSFAKTLGLPQGMRVAKAHGTGNTFIMVDNVDEELDITPAQVAALCHSTHGLSADGLICCVNREGTWFMDYRNSDGSLAEMCGNGVRAFVNHLRIRGFIEAAAGQRISVLTRAGVREVEIMNPQDDQCWYAVDMGPAQSTDADAYEVTVAGIEGTFAALHVDMPNPHAVIDVGNEDALHAAILPTVDSRVAPPTIRPAVIPEPVEGINIELIVDVTTPADLAAGRGRLLMRVCERGVGETASCGTGCCAAAYAAAIRRGLGAPQLWEVQIPGGRVEVALGATPEDSVVLSGPATHIADITLG